jgi:outer membrane protein TolC
MSEQENTREAIEMFIGYLEDAEEARQRAEDALKLIKNQLGFLVGDTPDERTDLVASPIRNNIDNSHEDLNRVRRRNKDLREQLEQWWRNV